MYQEQVLNYKHLDDPLDEGRLVFEYILAGNLQAFTRCRPQLFHVQDTPQCSGLYSAFVWLKKILFLVTK